jgi:hypothetical protein
MSDPGPLTDADSAASRNALIANRKCRVLIVMIMVLDKDRLGDEHIPFYVNVIVGGYDTIEAYGAIVIKHDQGFSTIYLSGIEPYVRSQRY